MSFSCLQCRLSSALVYCLALNSMHCLRKGRAVHPISFMCLGICLYFYLTCINPTLCKIPLLSKLALVQGSVPKGEAAQYLQANIQLRAIYLPDWKYVSYFCIRTFKTDFVKSCCQFHSKIDMFYSSASERLSF